jgi:hypothetical protein
MGNYLEVKMSKSPRKTTVGSETSIRDGALYFEDVRQANIDTELFGEMLEDKYTTTIRLESLASNWFSHEWLSGVGFTDFSIKLEMTLRSEIRSGTKVWYAYRRVGGVLFKRYVGQSDRVTTKRLVEVAKKLPGV